VRHEKDFKDFIKTFNKFEVEYCIVGAMAVSYYAKPRYTTDINCLIDKSPGNSKKTVKSIANFMGITTESLEKQYELNEKYFTKNKPSFFQIGEDPIKVHITNSIEGIDTGETIKHKIAGKYGEEDTYYISLEDLILNKKAANRTIDISDLKRLYMVKKDKTKGFSKTDC
jgi:hypothetical protein